jgi:outer membrane protein TolC
LELWGKSLNPIDAYPVMDEAAEAPLWREALAVAMDKRSELRQAQWGVRMAEVGKSRSLSERLSGLDLILRASSNSVDANFGRALDDSVSWQAPTYSAQLAYDLPIGNSAAKASVRRADSALREAWISFEVAERDVIADVRAAVRDVRFRTEALVAASKSLGLAQRQLEQEEARNQEGLSTNYQVLEVQQQYVEALSNQRQGHAEWAKARVNLQRAQGLIEQGQWVSPNLTGNPQE